jgi:hypothetical protein
MVLMRLFGVSLLQSLPSNDFKKVASGAQHGFVESRNNSSWLAHLARARLPRSPFDNECNAVIAQGFVANRTMPVDLAENGTFGDLAGL